MRHISRVLQVVAVMNQGGAENMIMNYYGSVVILGGLTFVNFPLCIHLC